MKNFLLSGSMVLILLCGIWLCLIKKDLLVYISGNAGTVYALNYATLNWEGGNLDFRQQSMLGSTWTTFIITLPNNSFLLTKFFMPVLPNAVYKQDLNNTFIYQNQKLIPSNIKITYTDGVLDGKIKDWKFNKKRFKIIESSVIIHADQSSIMSIENAKDFEVVKKLPGFENATLGLEK
jgi:hypothetical protein